MPLGPPRGSSLWRWYLITPLNKHSRQYEHPSTNLSYAPDQSVGLFLMPYDPRGKEIKRIHLLIRRDKRGCVSGCASYRAHLFLWAIKLPFPVAVPSTFHLVLGLSWVRLVLINSTGI